MHRSILLAAITGLVVVAGTPLTGCESNGLTGSTGGSAGGDLMANIQQNLLGEWTLDSLNAQPIADRLNAEGMRGAPNMTIADTGQVSGFAGVNRYFSQLDLSKLARGDFSLGPAGSTMMAGSPDAMSLENDFLGALNSVTKLDVSALSDGVLRLLGDRGQELLKFTR